jgi:hypothetical protein
VGSNLSLKRSATIFREKGKFHPRTGPDDQDGEWMNSSTFSLTSALDGVDGQRHAPVDLPPEKKLFPRYMRLGDPQSRSGQVPIFRVDEGIFYSTNKGRTLTRKHTWCHTEKQGCLDDS